METILADGSFRELQADYVGVGRVKKQIGFKPASKAGRFKAADFPLDYGGRDPSDPGMVYSGDVDFAGGLLTLKLTVPKTIVKGNKGPFSLFTCKKLTATVQVPVAPAQT